VTRKLSAVSLLHFRALLDTCQLYYNDVDVAIAAAAVADYKPKM
jgi:phosphopantothenoylcysteine decarboxylase/phosphopantothenate--cysteine ligase